MLVESNKMFLLQQQKRIRRNTLKVAKLSIYIVKRKQVIWTASLNRKY